MKDADPNVYRFASQWTSCAYSDPVIGRRQEDQSSTRLLRDLVLPFGVLFEDTGLVRLLRDLVLPHESLLEGVTGQDSVF